jgi:hypothetical protein
VPNASDADVKELIATYDVRGHFEGLVVLLGPETLVAELRTRFSRARALVPYHADANLVMVERQALLADRPDAVQAWVPDTARVLRAAGHQVLLTLPRRVLASVRGDTGRLEDLPLPGAVEFIPMAARALRPRAAWAAEALGRIRSNMKAFNPDIERAIASVRAESLVAFDTYLSGEASSLNTRNAYSTEVRTAANYLQAQFEGFGFNVTQETFRTDMGPNVLALKRGTLYPDEFVIMSAHYDSRASSSSSTTQRAPGANDDGSGTSALLEMARIISELNLSFDYSVILAAWCGEEQGLVGSRAYAGAAADEGMKIVANGQSDMIAFRVPTENYQCAFPTRYDDPDLTDLFMTTVATYVPQLDVCYTTACCSDHQSFTENGYSATQIFERCGSIADDRYHNSGDLVFRTGFDQTQWVYNTQAVFSNLCAIAGIRTN